MPRQPLLKWTLLGALLLAAILVPFLLFEEDLATLTERTLATEASPWVVAGLLASDILLPIPSSFVATASGYLLGFWWGCAATWAGLMLGTVVGYLLGLRYGRAAALRFAGEAELERVSKASEKYGDWTIIVLRAVPILAEASVVFAGLTAMPARRFVLLTALANLGIAASYGAVGAFAVEANSFMLAFAGSIALPGAVMLVARLAGGE